MEKGIIYTRKSTEDVKGLSISAQDAAALELVDKHNINLFRTYSEERSALHTGRPEFGKMMKDVRAGRSEHIICWHLNRLSRNMDDAGTIIDLLQKGVIESIITAHKVYLPDHPVYEMLLEFGVANQFSRDLSVNVKRGNFEKLKQGGWPNKAPVGYLNNKEEFTIELDPQRAPLVRKMFELYATGRYSLQELSDTMFEAGLTSRQGKNSGAETRFAKARPSLFYVTPSTTG